MYRCVFCEIVSKRQKADFVYEDDVAVAFLDKSPLVLGHVLVVPKTHYENLFVLPDDMTREYFVVVQRLAVAVMKGCGSQGTLLLNNNVVSQSVPHLHCHVIPRSKGDGFKGFFWPRHRYGEGEAELYVSKIARYLR